MPNPLDTLYDQLKGQYPDLVDRSEFIGKLSDEKELKNLHDAASKNIEGFVDFDTFKSKVGESLSTYDTDSDYRAQNTAATEPQSAPTDITIPRREKGRHVPSKPQNDGVSSEAYVPVQPGQPIDTHVDAEPFDRETGDLDELGRRYEDKAKRLEGYGNDLGLYVNEDEARKHYEAYSRLLDEAEQDRLVYNRRVKAAEEQQAEQQRQLDLQSKDRKTRRTAEYGGYSNDQVRKEQERLKKERAYLEDPKSKRKADYSRRVMEYNADQTALSGEADKRNKRYENKRAMYNEVNKLANDPDVQKRITGNDTVTYVLSGNNPYALQNYDAAMRRAKTMTDEELIDTCKTIAGQKYARGDNKDIYAPLASSFMAYHNELMYRLGGDEPKSALEMRYDMIDKATEGTAKGDEFMVTLRNYIDGTSGMGTANYENDQSERANIPQFAVVDYFNNILAQKEAENMGKVEQISRYPQQGSVTELSMAAAATDYNYDAMLQQAFEKFGDENLKAYITAYALRNGISIDEAARRVNQSIWDETIGKVMEDSRPKSNVEFFVRRITSDNMFSKLMQIGLRAQNGTLGSTDALMVNNMALDEYAQQHPGWETGAVVFNFAVMEGPIFSAYGKAAAGLVGAGERAIIGAATKTAERTAIESTAKALNQSFWYRLAKGVPTGGLVGFQYGTMSGAIDQAYYDGNVNFGKVIANGLHTTRDFAIMHGVGEVFGVTGDAILRRGQRLSKVQGKWRNRLETASLDFLNNVAKTTANAAVVTGLYAAIDKPALERENKKIEAENKKIEAENARLPEDQQKPLKPLNQIASIEDTFYSSLRMFAGLDAVGMLRRAWGIGVRGEYKRNMHVKVHFDKFDREALEKAFGKTPNSLLRQIVFGNVDGIPAKWFEIDPEAEAAIYQELGRELTPEEKREYATYGLTELRKVILNKDIPWATRAKIVSVITGRVVQEPPVAKGDIKFEMDSSGTVIKRIIVRSLDMEGNVIQDREFSGKEFEAARRLYESLNDRGWRNNAMLCGDLVIDAIEDKTYADTVDEMAREKGIAPEQFEKMVFGIKQKDITGEKVTYQERQLVDEFDKRHQEKQKAETELTGPSKLFEQVAREVFGAEWKRATAIPGKSWGEMSEEEKEFVGRYIERLGAMGVAERNKLMNTNPDWARAAKEYEESVRRRMAEAERPAEAEPLPALEDEKVSVETPTEERVEPMPDVIELEEEPEKEQPTQSAGPQDTPTPVEERPAEPAAEEKPATVKPEQPTTKEKPQAGTIGFEPVEQPTERERFDAERKAKAETITDADIEANREALGIPEGTALTDEARQIYAEDLAEDLMRYERFKRGESDEKARFHDYWESKFNPKRPKLEKPVEKQEEPVEEEVATEADALIEQLDNLKGRSDLEKYRHALKVFAGDDEIMAILEDLEPRDITEWVSSFLGLDNSSRDWSMLWESKKRGDTVIAKGFKEETGWSWNDVKGFAFMFDNKNGLSPRRVAEKIWEELPAGMKDQYSDVDVFDIMMDLFKSSSRKSDLTNYIRNNRMEQVRDLLNRRRSEELAGIASEKERKRRGGEEPIAEPVTPDESQNEFAVREDDVAPFSLLSLNYRGVKVESGTVRSRARTRKQIGTIAKALGYKIRWVADKPYNAKIDTDEKVLYLNIRTDMPLEAVMGHEVTHDLRRSDPEAYETLKRYAKDLLGQAQWDSEVAGITEDYNREYERMGWKPIRADKAEEEVVCDTMGKVLHTRKGLRELAGSLDPGVAGKVYRLIKGITNKVKSALGKEHDYSTIDLALRDFLNAVEQRAKKDMPIQDAPIEDDFDIDFSLRRKPAPKNTGVGYKVFFLKDGKLYPPMVANIGGEATPFGVWLDADAAPIAGKSKTGRNKVKAGGKGTQGGSGTLAYRPGWHLGKIPYALQFNRGKKVPNPLGILNKKGQVIEVGEFFPNDFVWAEVEYAADKDYQEEAHGYGVNANGKYNPSLAGLPRVPEDGSYEYRTNPNPATDPWIITGAMKVNKILKPSEVDEMVRAAGREPQKRQEGAFTDEQIDALNRQLNSQATDSQHGLAIDNSGGYSVTDKADIESMAPRMDGESEAAYKERIAEIGADENAFVDGDGQFSFKREDRMRDDSVKYFEEYHVRGNKDRKYGPLRRNSITRQALDKANEMIAEMRDYIAPWYDRETGGNRYLPEEVYGLSTIFDNASYGATLENTLICTRTLAYNDFCDSVKRKLGRPLTKRESFLASQMLYDIATDPQCLYCYVSLDRKAYDEYLLRYFDERDAVIERYNKMGDKSAENIDALYKTFLDGRKDTYQMRSRFNSWLQLADHDSAIGRDKVALSSDRKNALAQESDEEAAVRWREISKQYNRLRGEEKKQFKQSKAYLDALHGYLATEQGQIKDACAYAQGASWAKKEAEYRSYTGELLRTTKRMLGGLASHYGLRFYSFSEYSPAFILENMQMIRDAALRGLKGFAYTKEIDFCKIFLPTGININCSVYGRRNAAGDIVMDDRQGANWDEARALRDQYENMGIVFVATDDEMVRWAKAQPWVDVIIPFHIVRTGADIAEFYGWTNYTNVSADYDAQGRHKDIMPPEHNNSIEDYDRLIAERGLTRRFPQFYDGPGDQNYMKLINETRRKASDTPILTPVFNMEEAKKSFDRFVEKGGYWGGFYEVGADDVVRAVDEVVSDIEAGKSAGEVEYGRQDIDFDKAMSNLEKTRRRINRNREHGNTPKTSFSLKREGRDEERKLNEPWRDMGEVFDEQEERITDMLGRTTGRLHEDISIAWEAIKTIYGKKSLASDEDLLFIKMDLDDLEHIVDGDIKKMRAKLYHYNFDSKSRRYRQLREVDVLYKYIADITKDRLKELTKGINTMRSWKVKSTQKVTLDDLDALFKEHNKDDYNGELWDRVLAVSRKFGIENIKFKDLAFGHRGEQFGGRIRFDKYTMNDPFLDDAEKCQVLLHEMIHHVTAHVFDYGKEYLSEQEQRAARELHDVFDIISEDESFKEFYGASKNVKEMIAELSNPEFREALKKKNLWGRIIDGIMRLFGFEQEGDERTTAYSKVRDALEIILETGNKEAYDADANRKYVYNRNFMTGDEVTSFSLKARRMEEDKPSDHRARRERPYDLYRSDSPAAELMVSLLKPNKGDRILEPSAGKGDIIDFVGEDNPVTAVEINPLLIPALKEKVGNGEVVNEDFLNHDSERKYPRIVMNPPFGDGGKLAIQHTEAAFSHLEDGGRLVAIIPSGKEATALFNEMMGRLEQQGAHLAMRIDMPSSLFNKQSARLKTSVVVIDRNGESGEPVVEDLSSIKDKDELYNSFDDISREYGSGLNLDNGQFSLKRDDRYTPTFYSNAAKAVENVKQNKATAEQWKAMLTKAGGIKAGEDKWMGLSTWLDEHKGETLTKDEVRQFVSDNGIKMEETYYGEKTGPIELFDSPNSTNEMLVDGHPEYKVTIDGWSHECTITKNGDVIGTVAVETSSDADKVRNIIAADLGVTMPDKDIRLIDQTRLNYTTYGLENKREIAFVVPGVEPYQEHDEVHFGPENQGRAVMWVRFGETTDTEGKRVLVIDEIQSNRHQGAREKGYAKSIPTDVPEISDYERTRSEYDTYASSLRQKYGRGDLSYGISEEEKARLDILFDDMSNAEIARNNYLRENNLGNFDEGVPAAPFEKNWHEVAMKRMLRLAAEEGFDKVAWTTGMQQAERYDLGKYVDEIEVHDLYDGEHEVQGFKNGESVFSKQTSNGEQGLAELIGKDMARKAYSNLHEGETDYTDEKGRVVFTGDNLTVGGEGMKAFYDGMLPQFMNKYGKRWGVKVGEVTLNTPGRETMHSVDVNEEMRRSVVENGQPLFSLMGRRGAARLDDADHGDRMDRNAIAEEMEKAGKDARTIKLATGWERGADGKWRHEEPDGDFVGKGVNVDYAEQHRLTLSDIWDSPELFKAYPEFAEIPVEIVNNPLGASATTQVDRSYEMPEFEVYERFIRDYNQWLEDKERKREDYEARLLSYEPGEEMYEMLSDIIKNITREIEDAPNRLARTKEIVADPNKIMYMKLYLNKAHLSKDGVISADAEFSGNNARQVVAHEIQHLIQENEGFASGGTTRDMTYGQYRKLAGETEARNVSRRVDMPEYERRRSLASDTEDVPRERQTVRYTSKTSESNSSEVYTDLDGNEVYRETREDGTIEREITTMPDGSKRAEWFDKEGRIVKEQLDYYPNGEVRRVRNFDWNGLTREVVYDENGRTTSYYLPEIGTDWKLDENGVIRGKSNGVEIKPYNFQFSLKTYHGSGADFDRFNHDYVGSGEGNQAYGWGTYVTEVEGIGRRYAMIDYRRDGSRNHFLYSVEIPDEKEGKYLPYGERVSDPKVRKVLTDRLQQMADEYWNGEIPSYKLTELDKALNTFMPRDIASVLECSDKEVSQLLSKAGYTGVKYVANVFNRGQKGLSYNYVIFNEKDLGITDKEQFSLKRRRNRDDYTDEDRADAAIIANTYLTQADALRQQIEADRQREHQLVEERNKLLAFDYPAADPADRPAIMDRINALRNQINDLRNANYENNTKLRSMDYEYRVAKEILEQGAVTDEEAKHFDAGQMTREEKVLESLFKAAADSRADKKAKQKAIQGLVRELVAITDNFKAAMKARGIESQRKHYDKGTVDHIIRLAKAMMNTGYIDNMTSYEVKRLMGMINNSATRESIEEQAGRIVDMMLDHQIKTLRNDFSKQLKVTGQKTNSSGVQVQAGLDQEGQVVMEAMRKSMQIIADSAGERYDSNGYLTEWGEFYEKTLNDMGDADPVKAEQARKIFEGVWLASKWYNDVRAMEINGRILRSQMEDFKASNKPAKDADADTKQRYNDVLADYQEMLRQNKIKIIEAYERMTGDVGMTQAESVRRAKEFADAQKQRVNEIQHNANSDLADVDDNTQVETPESRVFGANKNNVLARLLFASAGTYEKFMRFFGRMAPNGEGYLFKRFMTQYHHARQDYWKGRHSAFEEMDRKMAEVFGKKKMHWSDIYEMTRDHKKFPPITVSYWDGYRNGQPYVRVDELNQSEALYLYMINKMPDGRMKLRHMGITDDVVQQMAGQIDNKLLQLADWLQGEFLPKMRIKYNETHKRVFGADMAAIEDYFPLRINKLAVASDMDITERDMNDNKPSTITGAIVKRRVNTLPIDLHTDAFDVALSHVDEMEHWSAFAEFNRDNNTLVNYKRFRTKVNNMRSLELGAGNVLWKNFTDAVAIAADAYHPRAGSRSGDHYSTRVAKFVSTAKIALRPYTALKQLLSIPAFWADSDPLEQMKATVNVADTWQWAIENLPGFAERWQSRQAGNIKLANYNDLSGLRRRKTMRKLQRAGMWANAAIDGLACAMGGKAVYETKLKRYRKMGYDEARAQEKALIDAAIAYNNSQQSSEGAYVSPLQVDRTWFANAFSVFRSASMGYTRRMNTSLRQLRNATFKPGYGAKSIEFLKKQMMRDGLTEEQAEKWARKIYRRANLKAAASVAIFGQILPFTWNLGANMFYLLFGKDDKEKEGILADSFRHSFFGPVEGLTGGNVISELGDIAADTAIGNIWGDTVWGDSEAYKTLGYRDFSTMPLSSDLRNLLKYFARDEVKAANEVVNILFQVATGVNPQTITDWATAILDFSRSDMERRDISMFVMRLLSTPQQQLDKFYLDQMNISQEQADKMSVDDLIKRYATYKRWRETPLTGWMYSDEREKEVEEKFQKRYEEMLEERSVAEEGLRGTINSMQDLPRKRTMMQKLQKELTDSIEATDPDLYKKALEGEKADDDEYVRHVTDKDVEQMAELTMKKKSLREAYDRKKQADKDREAGRITKEEYDAIYKECAHQWKLYNYLDNTLPKKLKEWKLKMEPDVQDKYTPEQIMDTIRSKTDKALQMRPEDVKMKKGDKKKVKKNKKK